MKVFFILTIDLEIELLLSSGTRSYSDPSMTPSGSSKVAVPVIASID